MNLTELTKLMNVLHNLKFEFDQLQKMTDRPVIRRIQNFMCWEQLESDIEKAHDIVYKQLTIKSQFEEESG
jgi:hypothetical protein|tara:strand:+ start:566 stop:778 length:213 start_codon:yes stop_codon:yes gene_type:complete